MSAPDPESEPASEAPLPAPPLEPPDRRGWALLLGSALLYLLCFALWFPPTHAIEDEVGFLNSATIWSRGAWTVEQAGLAPLAECPPGPRGSVGWRNVGRPLLTAPALAVGGYPAAFALGAAIHLALALAAAAALRRLGRSAAWALLLLWHPTLLLYSRSVMADELGALGCCLALWALLSRRYLWAGLALGAAVVARYHLAATVPVWLLTVLATAGRGPALRVALGGAPCALLLGAYNHAFLGSPLGPTGQGHFALGYLAQNLPLYGLALAAIYPGMLAAPALWALWRWGRRHEHVAPEIDRRMALLAAASLPLTALLCAYYFHDTRPSRLETLVVGQRLLIPALPAWVLIYAVVLSRELPGDLGGLAGRRRLGERLAPACALAGLVACGALMARHQAYLQDLVARRDEVAAAVPPDALVLSNRHLSKLLEVPRPGLPRYRLVGYEHHQRLLPRALGLAQQEACYLIHLRRRPGEPLPPAWLELLAALPGSVVVREDERLTIRRYTPLPR